MKHKALVLLSLSLLAAGAGLRDAQAQTSNRTVLTYQGVVQENGVPAQGPVDVTWRIYDAETNGNLIAQGLAPQVPVQDGLFTLPMELPALGDNALPPPDGSPSGTWWMEFCLRFPTIPACRLMSPRQRITPTVQALSARIASTVRDGAVTAAKLASGAVNTSSLQNGAVTAAKIGDNQIVRSINSIRDNVTISAGEGLVLSTVGNNNIQIAAAPSCFTYTNCYWNLRGNGNITSNVHFLGTVAGELAPLDLRVNNLRGLRLQPEGDPFLCDTTNPLSIVVAHSPSLVGGYSGNRIDTGVAGSVISGGGADNYPCLGGNLPNLITAPLANIGGGLGNEVHGAICSIGGGSGNKIRNSANYCVIAGGKDNLMGSAGMILSAADVSTISGGLANEIGFDSNGSTISGGGHNLVESNINFATIGGGELNKVVAFYATISGGHSNIVASGAEFATISGGHQHRIEPGAVRATIGGGLRNVIGTNAHNSTISGGRDHLIGTGADHATIGGGQGNEIQRDANHSTIGGGVNHTIEINAQYGTIGGGNFNIIKTNADYATIPGGRSAQANHYGQQAYASGPFTSAGDAQTSLYVLRRTTTTTAPAELFLDGVGQRMVLPVDSTWTFQVMVAARTDAGVSGGWIIQGVIERQANATVLVGANVTPLSNVELPIGTVTVEADNINEALVIRVTQGTPSIGAVRWVASTRTTEVIF